MRRILIASPVKDVMPTHYNKTIIEVLSNRPEGVDFGHMYCQTGGIHFARDQMADYAMQHGFDELIQWDVDLKPNLAMFHRLISHDVDILCGFYARKQLRTHFNVQRIPGNQPDANGLEVVQRCAIGFSKIKTSVYRKIAADTPERRYRMMNEGDKEPILLHQFHPSELIGPGSITGRYEAACAILETQKPSSDPVVCLETFQAVIEALVGNNGPIPDHLGEDYGFLRLAQQSGFKVHCDTQLLVPHGSMDFPIQTELLKECLNEPWRNVA